MKCVPFIFCISCIIVKLIMTGITGQHIRLKAAQDTWYKSEKNNTPLYSGLVAVGSLINGNFAKC